MLSKLLKRDLKKNMSWLWILYIASFVIAGATRGFAKLGENIMFFKVLGIFFDSVFYTLIINIIIQAFLRSFLNFKKSFYSDEAYLTHTLPFTKNQLINSKYITAIIEISLSFVCVITTLLIRFASNSMFNTLKVLLSTLIIGNFSLVLSLILIALLIVIEFIMFISIIFFAIVLAYKSKEKRVLKTFLYTAGFAFASLIALACILISLLLINGVSLSSATLVLPSSAFYSVISAGIIVYSAVIILFYFLTKKEFNKGVNVD